MYYSIVKNENGTVQNEEYEFESMQIGGKNG